MKNLCVATFILLLISTSSHAAEMYAFEVVFYDDGTEVAAPYNDKYQSLGAPNHAAGEVNYTSLGNGGTLIVKFKYPFMASGDSQPDLKIYEIGHDSEDCIVEIKRDAYDAWKIIGRTTSSNTGLIDIDHYLAGYDFPWGEFYYVKIQDIQDHKPDTADWAGADIDAVCALFPAGKPIVKLSNPELQPLQTPCLKMVGAAVDVKNWSGRDVKVRFYITIGERGYYFFKEQWLYFYDPVRAKRIPLFFKLPVRPEGSYRVKIIATSEWDGEKVSLDLVETSPLTITKCPQIGLISSGVILPLILGEPIK